MCFVWRLYLIMTKRWTRFFNTFFFYIYINLPLSWVQHLLFSSHPNYRSYKVQQSHSLYTCKSMQLQQTSTQNTLGSIILHSKNKKKMYLAQTLTAYLYIIVRSRKNFFPTSMRNYTSNQIQHMALPAHSQPAWERSSFPFLRVLLITTSIQNVAEAAQVTQPQDNSLLLQQANAGALMQQRGNKMKSCY